MALVGYLEGVDPVVLTRLTLHGVETLPLSNGVDQHGKNITLLTPSDKVSLVVGYFHKVVPVSGIALPPEYLLQACRLYKIPVLLLVPKEEIPKAEKMLSSVKEAVEFIDPQEAFQAIKEKLNF